VVPLALFFEGNREEESIAPNQFEEGRPPLAAMYARFKEIAARADVSEVVVGLHWEWNDPEYADTFPPADTVFIMSSAPRVEVEGWVSGLQSDGVLTGWPHGTPPNAPLLARGHHVYRVSWD
jgi:hypothetical protein